PAAQLHGADQIFVAPGPGLGLIAELLERVGFELARRAIAGIREHHFLHDARDPAIFAAAEILAGAREHDVRAAHVLDSLAGGDPRRGRIEIRRIGIVPAEIFLIDRARVVAQRTVIAA